VEGRRAEVAVRAGVTEASLVARPTAADRAAPWVGETEGVESSDRGAGTGEAGQAGVRGVGVIVTGDTHLTPSTSTVTTATHAGSIAVETSIG
jgi:hypothetical protein